MKLQHPGLISMPADAYHADSAIGHSKLVRLLRSPEHYRQYVLSPPEPTAAMVFGTAVHTAILEPERFDASYTVAPKFDRRTKEGKEAAAKFEAENEGKAYISVEDKAAILSMQEQIRGHVGAAKLLSSGHAELSAFWDDPETGVRCKCRPDWLTLVGEAGEITAIVDVKTTTDASIGAFAKSCASLGYDLQAAFYVDGLKAILGKELPFLFVAVEKDAPYTTAVYQADAEMLEAGRKKYRAALSVLKWCQSENRWPGYQPNGEIEMISLPKWAMAEAAEYDLAA